MQPFFSSLLEQWEDIGNVDTGGQGLRSSGQSTEISELRPPGLLLAFAGVHPHSTLAGSLVTSSINSYHQLEELGSLCFYSNSIIVAVRSNRHIMAGQSSGQASRGQDS